jgi:iron complex outermembrane recepter protein
MFKANKLSAVIAIGLIPVMSPTVSAQSGGRVLDEIVVVAQRKSQVLQDVPIAVNAVSGDELAKLGLSNSSDLPQVVPGLTFITTGPAATPFLRGIGSNAGNPNDEPSVATYVDGVYIASPSAALMSFNNLERVEVLKGPQGTLFGRNATGGVIQYITKDPSFEPEVDVSVGYGNYRTSEASLYATAGLTDTLAIDVAIQGRSQDEGWGKSTVTGSDIREDSNSAFRTKLLFKPTDNFTAKLSGDYSEYDTSMLIYTLPEGVPGIDGLLPPDGFYDSASHITYKNQGEPMVLIRQRGGSLNLDYDTDNYRFVSITAYRESKESYWAEADATALPVVEGALPRSTENLSQEFQVMSNGDQWLDWVAGIYLFENDSGYDNVEFSGLAFSNPPFSGIGFFQMQAHQETDSQSVYFQGTGEIVSDTDLTLGLRYTEEEQTVDTLVFGQSVPAPNEKGFDEFTWRVALNHRVNDDVMVYASQNRGIKGGGFDLLTPGSGGFDPEELDAWELGMKSELLDRTLRLNAALFYYDFKNIQVQVIASGTAGIIQTTNAAAATIQGLDVDFEYLVTDSMSLSGGVAWMDGEYDDFQGTISYPASPLFGAPAVIDASGKDTIRTPEFTGNMTLEYVVETESGTFPLSFTVNHNSGFFFGSDNRLEQDAYTLFNASAGWETVDEKYSVTLWGRNLSDVKYWGQGVPTAIGDQVAPAAPRTYGVTLGASF